MSSENIEPPPPDSGVEAWHKFWEQEGSGILSWLAGNLHADYPELQPADVDDIRAEALARMWKGRTSYKKDLSPFHVWCWITTRNTAFDFLRKRGREREHPGEPQWLSGQEPSRTASPATEAASNESLQKLRAEIDRFMSSPFPRRTNNYCDKHCRGRLTRPLRENPGKEKTMSGRRTTPSRNGRRTMSGCAGFDCGRD